MQVSKKPEQIVIIAFLAADFGLLLSATKTIGI